MLRLKEINEGISRAMAYVGNLLRQAVKGPAEGWVTVLILMLSVTLAVSSVAIADWVPMPGLHLLALWGVMLGLALAKLCLNGWLLAMSGILLGAYLSFHQVTSLVEGATRLERYAEVGSRLFMWGQALASGDVRPDTLPFSLFLLFCSWLAGFICSWSLFRRHNIWGAVVPSGLIIVLNLAILEPGAQRPLLYLYLLVTCLLIARLFRVERDHDWNSRNVRRLPPDSRLLPNAMTFALAVVMVTSFLPVPSGEVGPVAAVWGRMISPVRLIWEEFAVVYSGKGPTETPVSKDLFPSTNPFEGSTVLREEPILIVRTRLPVYLYARSYDVYTPKGWETGDTQMVFPNWTAADAPDKGLQKRQRAELSVEALFSLAGGEPIYVSGYTLDVSIGYQLEVAQPVSHRISLVGSEAEVAKTAGNLPLDLQKPFWQLWAMKNASHDVLTEKDIRLVMPQDVTVVSWKSGRRGIEEFTVERHAAIFADVFSVRTVGGLSAGNSYRAIVSVSTATESDLSSAGTDYPGWVTDRYLQLPGSIPSRVMYLAQELTKDVETPYGKAIAICNYLRTLDYAVDIEAPPDGTDGVDYFLFELKKGYCQYFASAMTVLLRACGVPSRMVVGYGPGEPMDPYWDGDMMGSREDAWRDRQDIYVVRSSHAWSEAFFPGYGWIHFEPTPLYPLIARAASHSPPQDGGGNGSSIVPPGGGGSGYPVAGSGSDETGSPLNIRLLGLFLGLPLLGVIVWLGWRRLLGEVSEPRAAYARVGYLAALSRMGPKETLTPQEYGSRLADAVPEIGAALGQIIRSYVRVSYSRHGVNSEDRSNVAQAWPQVRDYLLLHALLSFLRFGFGTRWSEP